MIFSVLIIGIFFFRLFFLRYRNSGKKLYCITIAIILLLISGMRSMYVGTDSFSYVNDYLYKSYTADFTSLISFIRSEYLYRLFVEFGRWVGANYTIFFTLIAFFYSLVTGRFVYKYSREPAISFLMLLSMGYFFFSMTGLRQTLAICFVILALEKLLDKNTKAFIILTIIASMFHVSALVTFLVLLINKLNLNFKYVFGIGILTIFVYRFGPLIIEYFVRVFWPTRAYGFEEYGGISTLILLIVISIAATVLFRLAKMEGSEFWNTNTLLLKLIMFSIPIQIMAVHQANAFRVAMYFHIVSIILLPNIIMKVHPTITRNISYIVTTALLLVQFYFFTYYTAGVNPYSFFWQV